MNFLLGRHRIKMNKSFLLKFLFFLLSILIISTSASASDKIVLQLRWDNQFQFAGYYAAKWQGFYEAEGIDVEIRSAIQADRKILKAVKEVSEGQADFGIGAADILVANDKGPPLSVTAVIFQQSASAFYAKTGTRFISPKDLVELTVARNKNDLIDIELQAMLRSEGIDPEEVNAYPLKAKLKDFTSRTIDVWPGYSISAPYAMQKAGISITQMKPSSYGVDFYGDSLFTTTQFCDDHPELVKKFTAASLKGWEYALAHSDEIATRISTELPRLVPLKNPLDFNNFQVSGVRKLSHTPVVELGHINPSRWGRMHEFLKQSGLVRGDLNLTDFIFDPDRRAAVKKQQFRKYLWMAMAFLMLFSFTAVLFILLLRRTVKHKTTELQQSEERFNLAMQATKDGLFDWNLQTSEVYFSPGFARMLGYESQEIAPTLETGLNLLHPDDLSRTKQLVEQCLDGEIDNYKIEFRMQHKQGHYLTVLARAAVVQHDSDNKALRIIGTHVNITDRKQAEKKLELARKQAELANVAKSQFLAKMSHEIRTPMNGILGMAQVLEMTGLSAEQQECVDALGVSGKNLLYLLDDILDLSKVEAGETKFENAEFNVRTCINNIVKMQNTLLIQKKVSIIIDIAEDIPDTLIGDQVRVKQILHNLLNNAVKFTEQGSITISVQLLEQQESMHLIRIGVSDSGIGISTEALEQIFQPFVQEEASIARKYGGTGLGLAISRRLAELMGGNISVTSSLGIGSCFNVTIPFLSPEGENKYQIKLDSDKKYFSSQSLRILFVEDEPANITVGKKLLDKLGHRIIVVKNGKDCLAALEQVCFDIVLMDIQMPIMNGTEALLKIRKKEQGTHNHQPVIALTAFAMQGEKERFLAQGFDGYVSKPLELDVLVREIRRVVGKPEASANMREGGPHE